MLKVTTGTLFTTQPAIAELLIKDVPIGISLTLSRMATAFEKDIREFDKKRMQLAEKYGTAVDNGFRIDDDKQEQFNLEIQELSNVELIYSDFSPVKISTLGDRLDIKPAVLKQLIGWLLEE